MNQFESSTIDPAQFPEESFELYSVPSFPTGKPEFLKGAAIGSTKQTVEPNDVLVCKINPRINRVWQVDEAKQYRQIASSEWIGFRNDVLSSKFYRHYFSSATFRELICTDLTGVGGSLTRAQPKRVATFPIPLAPLNEQKRIADKLDAVLARVDACRDRLDRIPSILKRFRQSVLAAATSGKLTEEWRIQGSHFDTAKPLHDLLKSDHENVGGHARGNASDPTEDAHTLSSDDLPASWDVAELRDICVPGRPITYGILKPGPELENGVPYIRVADFPGNKLRMTGIKKTSPEIDEQFRRARLISGDLLLSIRGSVGRLIKIPTELNGANITQDTARLSISNRLCVDYVYFTLLCEAVQIRMKNATRGVAVRGINIGDVRALQIPLPTLEEQTEIVRRIESLFAYADRLEAHYNAARTQVDKLIPTTLAKAFRGKLVPQDPNDEPASALLERIQVARAEEEVGAAKLTRRKVSEKVGRKFNTEVIMLEHARINSDHLHAILKDKGRLDPKALWQASQLSIEDFYEQLRTEEAKRLLREVKEGSASFLEAA